MKRVAILGSTGSIGRQTLDVIAQHPDRLQVVGLAARSNEDLLREQAQKFGVKEIALYQQGSPGTPFGMDSIVELAIHKDVDIVVVSVAGVIGLIPTIRAIEASKSIALASKEVLVAAGEVVMPLIRKHSVTLTPIDSEHSAIFQCLQGAGAVDRLILTASGGPFRGTKRHELEHITAEQALKHPTWSMGGKITIDSATLMNKALEVIEARWLFDVPVDNVDTVIHPQSIIHSMVKFRDGSVLGQMGWPDMRLPIQYALLYPERVDSGLRPWDPLGSPSLTFEPIDDEAFPAIRIGRDAVRLGGTATCAFNAANEVAANAFLRGNVGFLQIAEVVEQTMLEMPRVEPTLENVIAVDSESRQFARNLMGIPHHSSS
jgi:1-deoxy-D-xylulose-5-phosphate reductoisomerase